MIQITSEAICNFVSATCALGAAAAWLRSASAPIPFPSWPDPSDPDAVQAAIYSYEGFARGTIWNRRAAILAALSAFASFAAWAVPVMHSVMIQNDRLGS